MGLCVSARDREKKSKSSYVGLGLFMVFVSNKKKIYNTATASPLLMFIAVKVFVIN